MRARIVPLQAAVVALAALVAALLPCPSHAWQLNGLVINNLPIGTPPAENTAFVQLGKKRRYHGGKNRTVADSLSGELRLMPSLNYVDPLAQCNDGRRVCLRAATEGGDPHCIACMPLHSDAPRTLHLTRTAPLCTTSGRATTRRCGCSTWRCVHAKRRTCTALLPHYC